MPTHNELANAIRALSMDAVQQANSGHPGMPLGMADIATVLWQDYLQHNPENPCWVNRDRFILSNGHGSMLQYALLHLTGYAVSASDIKAFRQLHSKTPGHPEWGVTPGIETTTGPLGQGIANAVGMALAERHLASKFNRDGFEIVDHMTYTFLGDGCLMEGISHEVCSLAGTLGLGKLIAFWDDNEISIDGDVKGWFSDDTPARFEAYRWHVIRDIDGHDPKAIAAAISAAKSVTDKPSLICCKTVIGFGAPEVAGTAKAHGAPLGQSGIEKTREALGWSHPPFVVPEAIATTWDAREKGAEREQAWQALFSDYTQKHPDLAEEFNRRMGDQLPAQWEQTMATFVESVQNEAKTMATRKASQHCLNVIAPMLPELLGGSADLTGSNCTNWQGCETLIKQNYQGNYLHYGVREFGMTAIANGMRLYGGIIPFVGTFLTFSDYARNAVRLAALMQIQTILVYSHDSIGVGEDGPTHQPIEHAASLRLIPNLHVWRPADGVETAVAWQHSIEQRNNPSCLLLSRQDLPALDRNKTTLNDVCRGGYILHDTAAIDALDAIIIATGSEVQLAVAAQTILKEQHQINTRVVSMPCVDVFAMQTADYQQSVLPDCITNRVAVEAGSTDMWYRWAGCKGAVIGIDRFGESAPADQVFNTLGVTAQAVIDAVININKAVTSQLP